LHGALPTLGSSKTIFRRPFVASWHWPCGDTWLGVGSPNKLALAPVPERSRVTVLHCRRPPCSIGLALDA